MKRLMITLALGLLTISSILAVHFKPAWSEYGTNPQSPWNAMNIYVREASVLGTELGAEDEIGIFDGDTCVGAKVLDKLCSQYDQNWIPLKASMKGGGTSVPGSATEGNFIKFKLYVAASGLEYSYPDLAVHFSGPPTHTAFPTVFEESGETFIYEIRYDVPASAQQELSHLAAVPVPVSFPDTEVELAAIGATWYGAPVNSWYANYITASGTMTIR